MAVTTYTQVIEVAKFMSEVLFEDAELSIAGITLSGSNPVSIYVISHNYSTGNIVRFQNVGATEINISNYTITVIDDDNFTLNSTDSSLFSAWTSQGTVYLSASRPEGTWPDEDTVQRNIDMSAGTINMSLRTSGQFGETLDDDALAFLQMLNVIGAAILTENPVSQNIDEAAMTYFRTQYDEWLKGISDGTINLIPGETGSNYPAYAVAEQSLTPWNGAIILNHWFMRQTA